MLCALMVTIMFSNCKGVNNRNSVKRNDFYSNNYSPYYKNSPYYLSKSFFRPTPYNEPIFDLPTQTSTPASFLYDIGNLEPQPKQFTVKTNSNNNSISMYTELKNKLQYNADTDLKLDAVDVSGISCDHDSDEGFFRAVIKGGDENVAPVFVDAKEGSCTVVIASKSIVVDVKAASFEACGVKNCTEIVGKEYLCLRIKFPTVPGLRLPEDTTLVLRCRIQEHMVSYTNRVGLSVSTGAFGQNNEKSKNNKIATGGAANTVRCQLNAFRVSEDGQFNRILQNGEVLTMGEELLIQIIIFNENGKNIKAGGNDALRSVFLLGKMFSLPYIVAIHQSGLTAADIFRMATLFTWISLTFLVWRWSRLADVWFGNEIGTRTVPLISAEGCVHPEARAVCPMQPKQLGPFVHTLLIRSPMMSDGSSESNVVLNVRVIACRNQQGCTTRCGRTSRTYLNKNSNNNIKLEVGDDGNKLVMNNPNVTDENSKLLPYLSDAFKKEHEYNSRSFIKENISDLAMNNANNKKSTNDIVAKGLSDLEENYFMRTKREVMEEVDDVAQLTFVVVQDIAEVTHLTHQIDNNENIMYAVASLSLVIVLLIIIIAGCYWKIRKGISKEYLDVYFI